MIREVKGISRQAPISTSKIRFKEGQEEAKKAPATDAAGALTLI
ncbi:hypothetical protein [Pontibacter harenae]|nr:hypothetical protein [Pontibacter harenae]